MKRHLPRKWGVAAAALSLALLAAACKSDPKYVLDLDKDSFKQELEEKLKTAKIVRRKTTPVSDATYQLSESKIYFDKSYFADLQEDSIVRFEVSGVDPHKSTIQLYSPESAKLTEGKMANAITDKVEGKTKDVIIPLADGPMEYTLTAAEAASLRTNGLYVNGTNLTVTKVEAEYVYYEQMKQD